MERDVLIDSNFFISRLRRGVDPFLELARQQGDTLFYCCGVVKAEVCRGISQQRLLQRVTRGFEVMCWVPTTDKVWDRVVSMAWAASRRGETAQITDLIIAASALEIGAAVLTTDSDFRRFPGLEVLDDL